MKLKVDFHIHTSEDPKDNFITYDAYELIDTAREKGYDAIAITNHNHLTYCDDLVDYACQKDIILFRGIEKTIESCHVILLNMDPEKVERVNLLDDLKYVRDDESLIVIPHLYYPFSNHYKLKKHIKYFDAVGYSSFYFKYINFNKKIVPTALYYDLPVIGLSDAHFLSQLGYTYTLIEAKKNKKSIISAIKSNNVTLITRPMPVDLNSAKITYSFLKNIIVDVVNYNRKRFCFVK